MKTTIIRHLLLAGAASLIAFSSFSQVNTTGQTAYAAESADALNISYLKPDLSGLKNYVKDEKAERKILRYFTTPFEDAENITWGKVEDNVLAEFTIGNIKTRSLFDKRGNLVYTIDYADEKLLPKNYKQMIHSDYAGYKINQVARVNEALREVWIVKLEAPDRFVTVRIENNQPEEVEKFKKLR